MGRLGRVPGDTQKKIVDTDNDIPKGDIVLKAIAARRSSSLPDDYDTYKADQVRDMLHECSQSKLQAMLDFEKEHMGRQSVLRDIEQHLNQ